jgi:hypothetical protein
MTIKISHSQGVTFHAVRIAKCKQYRHLHIIERGSHIEKAARVAFTTNASKRCPMHDSPMIGQATVVEWTDSLGSETI